MEYPSDVLLPANAKYYGFVDSKFSYNSNWDITWSFSFALTGSEHAFCTFLTSNPSLNAGIPGQYLGYLGNTRYLLDEYGNILMDEYENRLLFDTLSGLSSYDVNGLLAIAFDSTGYFAISSENNPGIHINDRKVNSLIVRDSRNNVVYNESLSSLDTNFFLASAIKNYQTLRIRLSNSGKKLYIDKKIGDTYKNIVDIIIDYNVSDNSILYPGLTFCSPISSNSINPSTFYIKNFHTQGNTASPTYETIFTPPIISSIFTTYTTISGISGNQI